MREEKTEYKIDSDRMTRVLENLSLVSFEEGTQYALDLERYRGKLAGLVPVAMEVEACRGTMSAEEDGVIVLPAFLRAHLERRERESFRRIEQTLQGVN